MITADRDRVTALVVGAVDQHTAYTRSAHLAEHDLLRAFHWRDQSTSAARFIAGDVGFLTLIQLVERPAR